MVPMLLTCMLARLQLQFGSRNLCFLFNNATVSQLYPSLTKVVGEHTSKMINVKESLHPTVENIPNTREKQFIQPLSKPLELDHSVRLGSNPWLFLIMCIFSLQFDIKFFQNIIKYFVLLLLVFTREYFMDASKISFYILGLFYDYLDLTWINLKVMK